MSAVIKLSSPETHEFWEIPVLYEDSSLLALFKPSGLLTSPDRNEPSRPNLMKLLHTAIALGKPWASERNLGYLMNAHRLDFETSGVLLLAKTKPVLVSLANLFGSEKPQRRYAALVQGTPQEDSFEVDARLAPHPTRIGVMRVDPKRGKRSRTLFRTREKFAGWTWLEAESVTGRPDQIRAHLRHVGLPLIGDALYGGKNLLLSRLKNNYHLKPKKVERPLLERAALHAEELSLPHPETNQPLHISAPWPKDLTVAVKYLRRYAPSPDAVKTALPE